MMIIMNTHGQLQGLAEAGGSNAEAINTCWWPMGGREGALRVLNTHKNLDDIVLLHKVL